MLCLIERINEWSTSSASNDRDGNRSSYGAGSTNHQFHASNCLDDERYRKDFERLYEVIESLLPNKAHHAFQVGKYTKGHFIDAHDDAAYLDIPSADAKNNSCSTVMGSRDIAMVYYLTKNWSPDNGGCFIDLVGGQVVVPQFNTCILFYVPRLHRVEPVLNNSVRYSIFGWFFERGRLYELGHSDKSEDGNKIKTQNSKKKKRKKTLKVDQNAKK